MTTTTSYGSWNNHGDAASVSVYDTVVAYLGEFAEEYEMTPLVEAYRSEINRRLPADVTLNGDEFYGPYPRDLEKVAEIEAAIESVDLGLLAESYDLSNR